MSQPAFSGAGGSAAGNTANVVYILYLIGLVVGITTIVGVVIAYVNRADAPEWVQSHYQFQIRTFWIGVLYGAISVLTMLILVGWLLALFTVVWLIIRCAKGMKQLASGSAYPNVTTWLW